MNLSLIMPMIPGCTLEQITEYCFVMTLCDNLHNISKTAKVLGVSRGTVRNMIKRYNVYIHK